jgi:hypothetical protein
MLEVRNQLPRELDAVQRWALIVSAGAWVICILGWIFTRRNFFTAYLYSYLFFLGISLGSMSIIMLHHLTGGKWGRPIRGILESAMTLVPLMAILFIPIALGFGQLYEWAIPERLAHHHAFQHQQAYFDRGFVLTRMLIYFIGWSAIALFMSWASARFQETGSLSVATWMRKLSAAGLLFYAISMTFAAVDWVMSRQSEWASTIIGFIFLVGFALSAMALAIVILRMIIDLPPIPEYVSSRILIDLGNLLMTLVILWSYMSFAQFLVIWSGNIREEVTWYIRRGVGAYNGWRIVGLMLIVLHFFVPFIMLLFRYSKRHFNILTAIAALVLVMRVVDLYYNVAPSSLDEDSRFHLSWITPFPLLAIGGIWLFSFVAVLRRRPLVSRLEGEPGPVLGHGEPSPGIG